MSNSKRPRAPQAFDPDDPGLGPAEEPNDADDPREADGATSAHHGSNRDQDEGSADHPAASLPPSDGVQSGPLERGIRWGALLFGTMFALLMLATGVWFARFTSVALTRDDWVGWLAQGLLALLLAAGVVLVLKELFGFLRMARLSRIRRDAEAAIATNDRKLELRAVKAVKALARGRHDVKWDLAKFREAERHMREDGQLLGLADRVLLAEPDKMARRIVFESARRVGIVTAVVPIAFLVMLFVMAENIRMVRRLADAYGGRPGALGGIRLLWRVVMHVAASGAIALTDDLFGQFLGQDLVRRISRRLGEGAFVGALTARLGVAAIEVCRPLPYIEAAPLRSRHVVRELFPELNPAEMVRSTWRGKTPEPKKDGR